MHPGIFFSVVELIQNCFSGHIQSLKKPKPTSRKRTCKLIKIPPVSPKINGIFSSKPVTLSPIKKNPLHRLIKRDFVKQLAAPFEKGMEKSEADFLSLSERMASSQPLHAHLVVSKCLEQAGQITTPPNFSSHEMVPLLKEKKEQITDWSVNRKEERQFQITRPKL